MNIMALKVVKINSVSKVLAKRVSRMEAHFLKKIKEKSLITFWISVISLNFYVGWGDWLLAKPPTWRDSGCPLSGLSSSTNLGRLFKPGRALIPSSHSSWDR